MYESSLYFWWEFMGWLSWVLKKCTCLPAVFRLIRRDPLSEILSTVWLKKIWSRLNLIFHLNQNLFHISFYVHCNDGNFKILCHISFIAELCIKFEGLQLSGTEEFHNFQEFHKILFKIVYIKFFHSIYNL